MHLYGVTLSNKECVKNNCNPGGQRVMRNALVGKVLRLWRPHSDRVIYRFLWKRNNFSKSVHKCMHALHCNVISNLRVSPSFKKCLKIIWIGLTTVCISLAQIQKEMIAHVSKGFTNILKDSSIRVTIRIIFQFEFKTIYNQDRDSDRF